MKPRPERRPCRRPRYATAELAQDALVRMRRAGRGVRRWYRCERCRGYHLEGEPPCV